MYNNHWKALLLLPVLLAGCTHNPQDPDDDSDVPAAYAKYSRVPLSSAVTGVQPMTGIVMWSGNGITHGDCFSLEYSYMRYDDVCKEKDVYDWTKVESLLDRIASRGHQAVLRFYYTYVGKTTTVPGYIKALPDYEETSGYSEDELTWFPDWRNQELQRFHLDFYRRFAERYDKDPRLAFIETGFGLWAEYHIYEGPFEKGRTFPSSDFQAQFFRVMQESFIHTPWMVSIDAAESKYGPFKEHKELLDIDFGNFDDSFMCKEHNVENYPNWLFFGKERFKRAPFGGEFSYYTSYDQKHCLDKEGMHGRVFEDEVAKYHMTFIIGNDQPRHQTWERIAEASMSMGYRFAVKDFRVLRGKGCAVLVKNTGVAPIYHDAFFEADGVRSGTSLRELMPGDSLWVEITNPAVSASPVLQIACDRLVPGQQIGFDANCPGSGE